MLSSTDMLLKLFRKLSNILLLLLTIVCAVAQILAFFAQWIRPSGMSLSALLSMVEPFLFFANVVLLLFWMILWKSYGFISLIALIISFSHIGSYFYPRFSRDYGAENRSKKQLKIVTYNVKNFNNSLADMDSALTVVQSYNPDIVSIEEFTSMGDEGKTLIERKFPKLKYHVSNKGINGNLSSEFGILIFSRFPLKHADKYEYNGTGTSVMADAIMDYGDTVRLMSLHMYSTRYNEISKEKSIELYMVDSIDSSLNSETSREIIKSRTNKLLTTICESSSLRSYQADTIRQKVNISPYKTILMGDFNDTPYSYTVRTIMGKTHLDPFREIVRNEYGYTFNLLHRLFRIDYILPDKNYYKVVDYKSPQLDVSDHNPVMVTLLPY